MLSRVAENLFWLSRYVERSDGILRMMKINYASSQDALKQFSWRPIIHIFSDLDDRSVSEIEHNGRSALHYMIADKRNSNSVINIITQARENARGVQDNITKDLWQCLNEYYHLINHHQAFFSNTKNDPITAIDLLIKQVMLYYGTSETTMERGEGLCFMRMGKHLERSINSVDALNIKVKFGHNEENTDELSEVAYWKYLLQSLGGYEIYLKKYDGGIEAEHVIEQVILNADFPRSILYSVINFEKSFSKLDHSTDTQTHRELQLNLGRLLSHIQYSTVDSIQEEGLNKFLLNTKNSLFEISNLLNQCYFAQN